MKVFYDHLIPWQRVDAYIRNLSLSPEERLEIVEIIEETIHTEVLIIIFENLPSEKRESWLVKFHAAPHDTTHLHFLCNHAHPQIEMKIKVHINAVLDKLLAT